MVNIKAIEEHVMSLLKAGLPGHLTYHDMNHTTDVTVQCLVIAKEEGVTDPQLLENLHIASLYHDIGFIYIYDGHEARGCEMVKEQLPAFGVTESSIEVICGLIMATKIPQSPRNELERIICDADLDYLGRPDFFETSNKLRSELICTKMISSDHDWEERQLSFLQNHEYFTESSRRKRAPAKQRIIRKLLQIKNAEPK